MKKLFRYGLDCGRMGFVEGLFICTQEEVDNAIGRNVYFGEILGKHSEICGTLDASEIDCISEDQEKVEWLFNLLGHSVSGYNPLEYIEEEYEEDE